MRMLLIVLNAMLRNQAAWNAVKHLQTSSDALTSNTDARG
jgi:hypothetical protein